MPGDTGNVMQRRLAALLSADVYGYSRLMGEDEEDTVRTLTAYREVITAVIRDHRGRVVDSPGDNILAELSSVVDAVRCAMAIQAELEARNAERPEHRRMRFRIGVNVGDVIVDGERIYGDGVNIAARIEGLAAPGGICVSATAHDQVRGKLPIAFEPMGEQAVKNIAEPIRVYRLVLPAPPAASGPPAPPARQPLALPEKPSIVVLPFTNMSGDPEQEYFADGITEDLITALSKVYGLFVIASHSAFSYKGRAVPVQQVGREQGVRYVLEGSVRRATDRVRITAQLVDASTGGHLWADRYDRELRDVFSVQDDITRRIVTELEVTLSEGEQARLWRRSTDSVEAYEAMLRGREYLRQTTREGAMLARSFLEHAVALDSRLAYAHVLLGWTHWQDARLGKPSAADVSLALAAECVARAIRLDDSLADAYALNANLLVLSGKRERAISEAERAVALNPSGADAMVWAALALSTCGRAAEALLLVDRAMRFCPMPPPYYYAIRGQALRVLGRYEEARVEYRRALEQWPRVVGYLTGAAITAGRLGLEGEAQVAVRAALQVDPEWSISRWAAGAPTDPDRLASDAEILRRAGLPDDS
jgi:adenylate cyclase